METDIKTRIQKMRALPVPIQAALSATQTEEAILRIAAKYKLDKRPTIITDAVSDVLLGRLDPARLADYFSRLDLDKDTALAIAHDLQEAIFERLRPSLGLLYASRESNPSQFPPPQTHTTPEPLDLRARPIPPRPTPPRPIEKLDEREQTPPPRPAGTDANRYLEPIEEDEEPRHRPLVEGNTVDLSKNE